MKSTFKMLKSNKGFSLIEMIVVIGVLSVMTGLAILGMAMANNADVGKSAHALDSAINTSRTQCMAKGPDNGQITLVKMNGGLYYRMGDETYPNKICSSKIKFKVENPSGGVIADETSPDGDICTISFNSAGMVIPSSASVRRVTFTNNNRRVETVLYGETGKHEVNLL